MPKKKMPRRSRLSISKPQERTVASILKNETLLEKIQEMAETGASLSTIDARMKFPPNTLSKLLDKGKHEKEGPYRDFYLEFRSWAAESRWAAESNLARRSPEKWLDRNTTSKVLESEEDAQLALNAPSTNIQGISPAKVLKALQHLREQNISVDEILDKDALSFGPEVQEDPTDD